MPFENITLGNPYSKPPVNTLTGSTGYQLGKPTTKPLYAPAPKPTTTTVGNVTVNTTKPVIVKGEDKAPEVEQEKEVGTKGFWSTKTKKQKTAIIISVVAGVSLLAYIALKKK
jgi:hypothetical protein